MSEEVVFGVIGGIILLVIIIKIIKKINKKKKIKEAEEYNEYKRGLNRECAGLCNRKMSELYGTSQFPNWTHSACVGDTTLTIKLALEYNLSWFCANGYSTSEQIAQGIRHYTEMSGGLFEKLAEKCNEACREFANSHGIKYVKRTIKVEITDLKAYEKKN